MSINIFTKKPRPLPPPNLSGETDCEDQGFTLIADGCFACQPTFVMNGSRLVATVRPKFIKQRSPSNASLHGGGPLYWVCPQCKGYFGEVLRHSST